MITKSQLAIKLSKLEVFGASDVSLEQYSTDAEVAAESLWTAYMNKDIEGKTIADLGAGTGILGIAALELGAEFVYFVEIDEKAIQMLKNNLKEYEKSRYKIVNNDIDVFNQKVDTVIMNPPFGTKEKYADRMFLLKAYIIAKRIYTFHKTTTAQFIERFSIANGFRLKQKIDFAFPLKMTQEFHKSRIKRIEASLFLLASN